MPIWSQILNELKENEVKGIQAPLDVVRRKYLAELYKYSDRNCILYASGWLQKSNTSSSLVSINDEDIQAFMEVSNGLKGDKLDFILHSPGGSPEAAEAIVLYLRSRFSDIRVIVPQLAMSAATMIACSADTVVLGKHSFLGPVDPQILASTSLGTRLVSTQAVLDQFDLAQKECSDLDKLSAWLPMLSQYGPDLLIQCHSALEMSKSLVEGWLKTYMFKNDQDGPRKAKRISDWLASHENFNSHARHISRSEMEEYELKVFHLEKDPQLQDLALSVFHATTHTFTQTPAVKIVENHTGRAFVKMEFVQPVPSG
ncbi:MAG: serine protease [Bacteroidota bacterium]|nr:serine protease [Bacteroidota bacterium]